MITSHDIEEIICKLSSKKPKVREEGVKLLNDWLAPIKSIEFCQYLSRETARLKPNKIPHAQTWPFLLKVLTGCISLEISECKKWQQQKKIFATVFRKFVQRAVDASCSGKTQFLLAVVKSLFNHIWDVLRDVPTFQSEYGAAPPLLITQRQNFYHTEMHNVMNGINAPKVVECLGSDGHKYRQLAKSGNDDLRQATRCCYGTISWSCKHFFRNHRDTWKRRMGIRTYKVVPFTPSAGVLEWVDGTIPLGEYLLGSMRNGGAHGRYGVGDWSFLKCREEMANAKDKRKAFEKVCENFRPVMHNFLKRFLQPASWFEKRLCYARSVAASSMVGYIVGLGDRHSMNILIDQATAEVVHIDLGVAFEQGLMLKTPERVPFRLTRDIIDGMGITGVEGVFRRCCEKTLYVMRTNKEALLTIIEVFIHDPLYKWALSPLKALQLQKETDDDLVPSLEDSQDVYEGNKDAARALLRVKQKLDGYEGDEMRTVHGQVQQLIQDAIDPDRLCQMYPGWRAWL